MFYVSLGLLSSFPEVMIIFYEESMSLRRLHTYNRTRRARKGCCPSHIHYHVKIVLDEVVNLFATKHPRRLELGTILTD